MVFEGTAVNLTAEAATLHHKVFCIANVPLGPEHGGNLRKIVVDLAEQLDRSLAEQNKYQSLLREILEAHIHALPFAVG
jgi:hypothetical protein